MTHPICGNDAYANARVDAAVAEAIAGINNEPFWVQAQTNMIRWVRIGSQLAEEPEPGSRSIAETASSTVKLEALVAKARDQAQTTNDIDEAQELERWLTHDWLPLDARLKSRLTKTLADAGAEPITLTSRDGRRTIRLCERTGSWDQWDPASLPDNARRAAEDALTELWDGHPHRTTHDSATAASNTRATGSSRRKPNFGLELMTASIDTIEQAGKTTKTAGRRLKNDLTRRNSAGKTPNLKERRLRTRALKAAETLETVATDLRRDLGPLVASSQT